jgi:DNA transformation protein
VSDDFVDYVMELLGPFGTVTARRMFGSHGICLDGLMFAIISEDALYLKADDMSRVEFEQAGCEIFGYARQGKRATLNFYRAPEDAMESPDLMLPWARSAYAAALRANAKKQAAERARAEAKFAQQLAVKKTRAAAPALKRKAKKSAPAKPGRNNAAARKTRPAKRRARAAGAR